MSFFTVTAPDPGKRSDTKGMLWGLFHLATNPYSINYYTE